MKILLSNDDGYRAPGIQALRESLAGQGHDVWMVAPDRNRSGASNSLTLETPLRVHPHGEDTWSVTGTPSDCVLVATTGLLEEEPDMVVSGINQGANLGDDVLYSGTVAAAMEGRFLGYPAIAVSLASYEARHYQSAVMVMEKLMTRLAENAFDPDIILNVNVPDLPWEDIKGWRVTRLGSRHKSEPVIVDNDPRGRTIYWIGPPGVEREASPDSDFQVVNNGYVSITPLKVDLTRHDLLDSLPGALGDLGCRG